MTENIDNQTAAALTQPLRDNCMFVRSVVREWLTE